MKRTPRKPVYKSNSLANLLFEQEEDLFADEPEAEEEEPAGDEEGEGDTEEEPTDEEGTEGEGEGEADEEEKLDVDVEEEVKLSKSIDQDLEALLIDFEAASRKSKQITDDEAIAAEEAVAESRLRLNMLLEQEETDYQEEIDIDRFASEVARLVKNYTTLLDMEKMLVSKAREFIVTRYGEDAEADLLDVLNVQHDIVIDDPPTPLTGEQSPPIAVGAGSGGAGGAGA